MTEEGRDRMTRARKGATSSGKPKDLWSTPRTVTGGGESSMRKQELGRTESGGGDLQSEVELWQTPAVDSFRSRGGMRKDEMGLDQQARFAQFPTPAARDYRSESGGAATMNHFNRPSGPSLPAMIEHSFLPAQQTGTPGGKSSEAAPTSRRRLNTKFVEWLQGLPGGWTSPDPISSEALGTWSFQCKERLLYLFSSIETRK